MDEEVVVGLVDKVFEAMPCCSVHCNHLMYRQKRGRGPQDCNHHAYADHQHSVAVDAHSDADDQHNIAADYHHLQIDHEIRADHNPII